MWLSAEQPLIKAIFEGIYNTPLFSLFNGQIYDKSVIDVEGDTYLVVGETNTVEQENGQGMHEVISVTFHVYHKNEKQPELAVNHTRELMRLLKYYVQRSYILEDYEVERVRLDVMETITDVDLVTQHGVLRLKYYVRHKLIKEMI